MPGLRCVQELGDRRALGPEEEVDGWMIPEHQGKLSLRDPTWEVFDLERFEEVEVPDVQVSAGEQFP